MNLFIGFQLILLFLQFTNGQPSSKISEGVVAKPGEFPFIVAIRQFFVDVDYCSGIILTEEWILTVASCLITTELGTGTKFLGGEHDLRVTEGNEQLSRMATLFRHPNWTMEPSGFIRNDLMLVKLQTPFLFNEFVQPAVLAPLETQSVDNAQQQHTIAGWGRTCHNNFTTTNILHKAVLQEIDATICATLYPSYFDETMMCSGRLDLPNSGSCWGDWGGPVLCSGNQVCGIISIYDVGPCAEGKPTLSIKLAPYLNWIQDTMDNYDGRVDYSWVESNNSCGGILESSAGHIRYKVGEIYNPNERCVWTIRPKPNRFISFRLGSYGLRDQGWVAIARISMSSGEITYIRVLEPGMYFRSSYGQVYFLTFLIFGDNPRNGTGFSFIFESEIPRGGSDLFHSHALISEDGLTSYPEDAGFYKANELSTLVFNAGEQIAWLSVTRLDILGGNNDNCDEDVLRLYVMSWTSSLTEYNYCGRESEVEKELRGEAGVIIAVFRSDDISEGTGFSLQFKKRDHPTTSTTARPSTTANTISTTIITQGSSNPTTIISTTSLATVPTTTETPQMSRFTEIVPTSTQQSSPQGTSTTLLTTTSIAYTTRSTTFTPEISGAVKIFGFECTLLLPLFALVFNF